MALISANNGLSSLGSMEILVVRATYEPQRFTKTHFGKIIKMSKILAQ